MTPRIDMVCAAVDVPLDALAERFVESGHSRLPIFEDSIDHVVGILHIRDVLRALRRPSRRPSASCSSRRSSSPRPSRSASC